MNGKRWTAKGIFLDLDGTIVDSTEAYMEAARIAFKAVGKKMPESEICLLSFFRNNLKVPDFL